MVYALLIAIVSSVRHVECGIPSLPKCRMRHAKTVATRAKSCPSKPPPPNVPIGLNMLNLKELHHVVNSIADIPDMAV